VCNLCLCIIKWNFLQEKYIDGDDSNPTDTWWVPVYISPRPNTSLPVGYPDAWIPQNVNEITVSLPTDQLIVINPGAVGKLIQSEVKHCVIKSQIFTHG